MSTRTQLDWDVLSAIDTLSDSTNETDAQLAILIQRLWMDRNTLYSTLENIQNWDLTHAEALDLERVFAIIELTFEILAERE